MVISSESQMNLGKKQTTGINTKFYFLSNFIWDLTVLGLPLVFQQWLHGSESHHRISSRACVLACCHIFCLGLWLFLSHFSGPTGSFRMLASTVHSLLIHPKQGIWSSPCPKEWTSGSPQTEPQLCLASDWKVFPSAETNREQLNWQVPGNPEQKNTRSS